MVGKGQHYPLGPEGVGGTLVSTRWGTTVETARTDPADEDQTATYKIFNSVAHDFMQNTAPFTHFQFAHLIIYMLLVLRNLL